MTRGTTLARAVFALLVAATFAAFLVTQRLKHSTPVVSLFRATPYFSPYSAGPYKRELLSFRIKRADQVTVTIIDGQDNAVATLASDQPLLPYRRFDLQWDGRTSAGRIAPDGVYRVRIGLRDQGRSVLVPRSFRLEATAPNPQVTAIYPLGSGPAAAAPAGPAILPAPGARGLRIDFQTRGGSNPQLIVYRTDVAPAQLVTQLPVAAGATSTTWDGTVAGRRVPPGTYLVAIRVTDQAENVGSSPPVLPPSPRAVELPTGRPGITVRDVGVQPPVTPSPAGGQAEFGVDARKAGYRWSVQRVGAGRPAERGGARRALLRVRVPRGSSGVYVLSVSARGSNTSVPFAVTAAPRQRVLVVLPMITWLGADPLDDFGSGLPNTLAAGQPVRLGRIFANGLPGGFAHQLTPLLTFLDRHRLHYDVTTDVALAQHRGPALAGHTGVLLVGGERWLPADLQAALPRFVSAGGRLASLGVASMRAGVTLTRTQLTKPGQIGPGDIFGATLNPIARGPVRVTIAQDAPAIGLFSGGSGLFTGFRSYEETQSVGARSQLLSSGVDAAGHVVIVATRYGRGLIVRTGLPGLPGRVARDPNAGALISRIWQLLSR